MKYFSTNLQSKTVTFRQALFSGLAPDGGLYMPQLIPKFDNFLLYTHLEYPELATEIIYPFMENEIDKESLEKICRSSFMSLIPCLPKLAKKKFI